MIEPNGETPVVKPAPQILRPGGIESAEKFGDLGADPRPSEGQGIGIEIGGQAPCGHPFRLRLTILPIPPEGA